MRTCDRCEKEKLRSDFFEDDRGRFWCKQCVLDFLVAHGDEPGTYRDAAEFVPPSQRNKRWTSARAVRYLQKEIGSTTVFRGDGGIRSCEDCDSKFGGRVALQRHQTRKGCWTGKSQAYLHKDEKGVWRNTYNGPQSTV